MYGGHSSVDGVRAHQQTQETVRPPPEVLEEIDNNRRHTCEAPAQGALGVWGGGQAQREDGNQVDSEYLDKNSVVY